MFEEMQSQLSHLDAELNHTKAKSERQAREFAREKKEERHRSEMEREALTQQHEEQVMQIVREHRTEMERLRRELEEKRVSDFIYIDNSTVSQWKREEFSTICRWLYNYVLPRK